MGLLDWLSPGAYPALETLADDLESVMEAANSRRAAILRER